MSWRAMSAIVPSHHLFIADLNERSPSTLSIVYPALTGAYVELTAIASHLQLPFVATLASFRSCVAELDPTVRGRTPAGIAKMRELCEAALTAAGLHVTEAGKLWSLYRCVWRAVRMHLIQQVTRVLHNCLMTVLSFMI